MKRTALMKENHKESNGNAEITRGSNMATDTLSLRNGQEHTINLKIAFYIKKVQNLAFDTLKNPHCGVNRGC